MEVKICKIGMADYKHILDLQYALVKARAKNIVGDTFLLTQHPPVITKGKRTDPANIFFSEDHLKKIGIKVYEVNRGGDVTYHGPGQIIGYPIIDLKEYKPGIREFINNMQSAMIDMLKEEYSIEAYPQKGKHTGVWVGQEKIAAFGLAVVNGITMHGFAFNVNTNLSHFDLINPCGLSKKVTSIKKELGREVDFADASDNLLKYLTGRLDWEFSTVSKEEIIEKTQESGKEAE